MSNKFSINELEPPRTWTPIDFPYRKADGTIEGNKKHLHTYFCDECDYSTTNRYDFEKKHMNKEKHKENFLKPRNHTCKYCGEQFSAKALKIHNERNRILHKNLEANKITNFIETPSFKLYLNCNNYYLKHKDRNGDGQRLYPLQAMWLAQLMTWSQPTDEYITKDYDADDDEPDIHYDEL